MILLVLSSFKVVAAHARNPFPSVTTPGRLKADDTARNAIVQ